LTISRLRRTQMR